jgi:hypothetical protein
MEIELIDDITSEKWDEAIAPYESTMLSHQSAWLNFLAATNHGRPLRFRIREQDSIQGYFVALLQRKGFFNLLGSPLTGWRTDYMGPIVNRGFDQEKFLSALDDLARSWKIDFLQIGNPFFDPNILSKMGYTMGDWKALVVNLHPDPEMIWRNVSSKCRNRIRKGRRNGLVVENCEDPAFIDEFYSQLKEVFTRKKLSLPFSITLVRSLYQHLMPNNLFALRVKYGNETVATGLFTHDNQSVTSFGMASRSKYLYLCPNELLNWSVMSRAGKLGLHQFIIGHNYRLSQGVGQFKKKFKCRLVSVYRYSKSYSAIAKIGHELFGRMYTVKRETSKLLSTKSPFKKDDSK